MWGGFDAYRQAVSNWETNKSEPSTANLIKLADFFDCDVKEIISPERYSEEHKNIEKKVQKNIKMQMAAVFGRIFMLVGFTGYMGVDQSEFASMPNWYPYVWWGAIFSIGAILTFVGSWDYFNRKSGSKKIIWFDFLFTFSFFLYRMLPFEKSTNTLVIMLLGIVILSIQNIKFWIPIWKES